ncbi:MAG: acylase [bacterium]|nr:acylase [bacterium]
MVLQWPAGKPNPTIKKTEILWDKWGVPHIFGKDMAGAFYAFGHAQMESHGNLILQLYGEARGRAAEYWGESNRDRDIMIRTLGIPQRGEEWFRAYDSQFRGYLESFIKGMNDYAVKNREKLDPARLVVLPLSPADVLRHTQRLVHMEYVAGPVLDQASDWRKNGSNGWAIAPSHSDSGNALLLINPHLNWSGLYTYYEAQFSAPGIDVYGITFLGFPLPVMGFNRHLGWAHTVNVTDGADLYELKPKDGGYLVDGKRLEFQIQTQTLKIKTPSGTLKEEPLIIRVSVFGPVVKTKGDRTLALKVAGFDRPLIWRQWFDMARATHFDQFESALRQMQGPMFNIIYADRDGHIMMLHNALVPKRRVGDWNYWQGIVPGDTSKTLWNGYHSYGDLPGVKDPPNGWVQNANDPPWTCTYPVILDPADYPPYMSLPLSDYASISYVAFRPQRSIRMLREDNFISLEELTRYKYSTRMESADRLLDDLASAVHQYGGKTAQKALRVLQRWDRSSDAGSRGGVLYRFWFQEMGTDFFARPWQAGALTTTPDGFKDPKTAVTALETAANRMINQYIDPDIQWGSVHRFNVAGKDLPANGGPGQLGNFQTLHYKPGQNNTHPERKFIANFGDTFTAAVEFSNPVKARVLLNYGNSSQPGSPHRSDQLEPASQKKLRPALLTRLDIEKYLEKKEVFDE